MPSLEITRLTGFSRSKKQSFANAEVTLGTDAASLLRFDPTWDKTVAARHAVLRWQGSELWVEDLGSRDGITNNMPVLTTEGLIGRIGSVSFTRSQVVLLGDHDCKVAARVENDTHDSGIISGSGPLNSEFVEMNYLSAGANLKPGQHVRTSGNGGLFPKGIMIGTVVDSHSVEYGLAMAARVKLAANPNSLEEVWVKVE